jgi:Fe(3+) dicitrate transport protein
VAGYAFLKDYNLRSGVNNLTDGTYATRRMENLDGILRIEGRTFFISVELT